MSLNKTKNKIDIEKIIRHLDEHLKKTGRSSIDPVEANKILAQEKLLGDSKSSPGLPLRKLLRKGRLPHAYQSGGKGSSWVIPLSSTKNTIGSNYEQKTKSPDKEKKNIDEKTKPENIDEILKEIERARLKYKPNIVKYLLIAEAPPDSIDRFFYYEDVKEHDYLFLGVAEALYPELKSDYLNTRRSTERKKLILEKFQSDGFYLLDLSDLPLSLLPKSLETQLPELKKKIDAVFNEETKIILIKANVYKLAYPYLTGHGLTNVVNKKIQFPGQGWQKVFQEVFNEVLVEIGYK